MVLSFNKSVWAITIQSAYKYYEIRPGCGDIAVRGF